jgi:PilZ domain
VQNNFRLGRRRSQRVSLRMPVVVSEPQADPRQSLERAHTLSVSRHGGLLALSASVNWGQSLLLTNPFSRVSQECRVVYVGRNHEDKRQVGVEFLGTVSNFWNISFPSAGPVPEAPAVS